MSGGSFDYAYQRTYQFADELKNKIESRKQVDDYGQLSYDFDDATIQKLREIEQFARKAAAVMKEAEWLYSGDTGPETFAERLKLLEF